MLSGSSAMYERYEKTYYLLLQGEGTEKVSLKVWCIYIYVHICTRVGILILATLL